MSRIGLGFELNISLRQQQTIAPQMIQSMEILQMPILALQEKIQAELQENPFLELRERQAKEPTQTEPSFNADAPLRHDESGEREFARMDAINQDWGDHFNEDHQPSRAARAELSDQKLEQIQNVPEAPRSLQEHLLEQLPYLELDELTQELCEFVISHLDDNGYLLAHDPERGQPVEYRLEDLATTFGRGVTADDLDFALSLVQELDPAGVGARNTKECLLLQVADDERPHAELIRNLIRHHLEDIAHNRLPLIQKKTGAELEAIREAIDQLRTLDPKPGARFASESAKYIVPDIRVTRTEDGDYEVTLTNDWTPNVRVSKKYVDLARDKSYDPKTREYLTHKFRSASWIIDAIQQRRATLTKVTQAIIRFQRAFLDKGPDYIQPLKMEQIAEQVGVHVTTVSRAVDDKWVETPRGLFPLKRFFGGGTYNKDTGESVAWETIKQKLLEIIGSEDKTKPYSDEDIVENLKAQGLDVARRTVTKYREALKIPSSRQRRSWTQPS